MAVQHVDKLNDLVQIISENKKVVIKFSTPWCGPCKMYGPIFEEVAGEVEDVTFVSVDLGNADAISKEFKVSNVPLTVITVDGQEASRFVGVQPKVKLKELL